MAHCTRGPRGGTNLHAAYLPEGKTLVLAGWDPTTEACAWINFDILPDPLVPPAIAAPTNWLPAPGGPLVSL